MTNSTHIKGPSSSCHSHTTIPPSSRRRVFGSYRRILFVDDEPLVRSSLARALSERGFLVDVAGSAAEAIELAERAHYPVVLTDIMMPGINGIELVRTLHRLDPSRVFVLVTGQSDIELPNDPQLRHNIVSIVRKPWDVDELVQTLHRSTRLWESRTSQPPASSAVDPALEWLLLVEDDEGHAHLLKHYLQDTKFAGRVKHARRLSEALTLLDEQRFGVIMVDLELPDARGLDAVLRVQHRAQETPLVVITEHNSEVLAGQALQAGAQDFLVKSELDTASLTRSIRYARERKRVEEALSKLAYCDPLTGLANRESFKRRLKHALARCKREGFYIGVLFIDLDNFKPVNDRYGHAAGDQLLSMTGERIVDSVRDYDVAARLGGDEFAVILDGLLDEQSGLRVVKRILAALNTPYELEATDASVSASIGVAFSSRVGTNPNALLLAADRAMYAAKRQGRNCFAVGESAPHSKGMPLVELEEELAHALDEDEFLFHYQPIVNAQTVRPVAAEALLRWRRGNHRLMMPGEFLQILERSNEMLKVGAWGVLEACKQVALWHQDGITSRRLSVNVSARQLDGNHLLHTVQHALGCTAINPKLLELEITETAIMADPPRAQRVLAELKDIGVSIAMDDFGVGYSSLASLYRLPLDTLKLDRSFAQDICESTQCATVVRGMVDTAKNLGLRVVAEGVETEAQQQLLTDAGCDLLQGFLFARPMAANALASAMPHA